jgi:hypothetical protein
MTTRADLRNLIRRRTGDLTAPYKFSDLQINQFINDAIAEYTVHFPRRKTTTLACVDGQRKYDLPDDFHGALSVEYPTGEEPPVYLARASYSEAGFWEAVGLYDVIKRDPEDDSELWISEAPEAGQTITVEYHGDHDYPDLDADLLTVRDRHLELLALFVRWCTLQELASEEAKDPDPTTLNINTLELNAFRAERAYKGRLEEVKRSEQESDTARWTMDKHDQVY